MQITPSPLLFSFLKAWEGPPHFSPRQDPVNPKVWDIGYGHVCSPDHPDIDFEGAELILRADMDWTAAGVRRQVRVILTQNQFDALVSFAFNVGLDEDSDTIPEGLGDSTLLKYVNLGSMNMASKEFAKWNKSGGHVVTGLTKRRAAERDMFLLADYSQRP